MAQRMEWGGKTFRFLIQAVCGVGGCVEKVLLPFQLILFEMINIRINFVSSIVRIKLCELLLESSEASECFGYTRLQFQ